MSSRIDYDRLMEHEPIETEWHDRNFIDESWRYEDWVHKGYLARDLSIFDFWRGITLYDEEYYDWVFESWDLMNDLYLADVEFILSTDDHWGRSSIFCENRVYSWSTRSWVTTYSYCFELSDRGKAIWRVHGNLPSHARQSVYTGLNLIRESAHELFAQLDIPTGTGNSQRLSLVLNLYHLELGHGDQSIMEIRQLLLEIIEAIHLAQIGLLKHEARPETLCLDIEVDQQTGVPRLILDFGREDLEARRRNLANIRVTLEHWLAVLPTIYGLECCEEEAVNPSPTRLLYCKLIGSRHSDQIPWKRRIKSAIEAVREGLSNLESHETEQDLLEAELERSREMAASISRASQTNVYDLDWHEY